MHRGSGQRPRGRRFSDSELTCVIDALLADIVQMRRVAAAWNAAHPDEIPIDPDPGGQLSRMEAALRSRLDLIRQIRLHRPEGASDDAIRPQ
jgi:hypothetical protein